MNLASDPRTRECNGTATCRAERHLQGCLTFRTVTHDVVNHPSHYTSHPSGVECIQVTEHMGFNLGNVIKYLWRSDEKGAPLEDLEKAAWYLAREIKRRKGMQL